jgi:hypothetical protein
LVLAHLRCGHTYAQLAAGFGVGTTTVDRNVVEAVEALAAFAPDVTTAARVAAGKVSAILDGRGAHGPARREVPGSRGWRDRRPDDPEELRKLSV